MSERSITAYQNWRESSQQFDYYALGLIGVLCAYVAQNLKPEKLAFSPFGLQVLALAVLISSAIFGFRRVENNLALLRYTHSRLEVEEQLAALLAGFKGGAVTTQLGQVYQPDQVERMVETMRSTISNLDELQKKWVKAAGRNYLLRNWSLFGGFVLLVVARILEAYA